MKCIFLSGSMNDSVSTNQSTIVIYSLDGSYMTLSIPYDSTANNLTTK